jgi:hypothetical protein
VLGASFDGETVLIFGADNNAYLFTWKEGDLELPFFGRSLADQGLFRVEQDKLTGTAQAGQVYILPLGKGCEHL